MNAVTSNVANNAPTTMSAIDRALAAARARKAARDAMYTEIAAADPKMSKAKQIKTMKAEILDNLNDVDPRAKAKPAAVDAGREAARAKRDAERVERLNAKAAKATAAQAIAEARKTAAAQKKAERAAAAATKRAEAQAKRAEAKTAAHMRKVERARSKLPLLEGPATAAFTDLTANLSVAQLEALAQHLMVHARTQRTVASVTPTTTASMAIGDEVQVVGGEAKYVGMTGTLVVVNKLRVQVKVPARERPLYLYRADVKPLTAETAEAAQLGPPGVG